MTTLNITFDGESAFAEVGVLPTDADVRRTAVELLRGGLGDLYRPNLPTNAFDLFVVDRFEGVVYLRPKVPFG